MVIVDLTHTLRGNCSVCQLLRWSKASICPHTSLLGVSGLFVLPSQKEEICSTWFIFKIKQSSTKRTMSPPHSWLWLHGRKKSCPLPCSTPAQQCCCCFFLRMPLTACTTQSLGQPHFASSEYLWMLLNGHIPLSGRLPGMGLPILSPCSRLSGSLALHPIAVCISPCLAATSVAGVIEKNERLKTVWGKRVENSQVKSKKKKSIEEKDECRFQGYKA